MGHANMVYHGAGWMEGGLTASFEKIVLDVEMLQMMAETIKPVSIDEFEIDNSLKAIAGVPSGGHFFGSDHTLARYKTAFYQPMVSNWQNYEAWTLGGERDATQRATEIWQAALAAYEPPSLEPDVKEVLAEFVARRKQELSHVDH